MAIFRALVLLILNCLAVCILFFASIFILLLTSVLARDASSRWLPSSAVPLSVTHIVGLSLLTCYGPHMCFLSIFRINFQLFSICRSAIYSEVTLSSCLNRTELFGLMRLLLFSRYTVVFEVVLVYLLVSMFLGWRVCATVSAAVRLVLRWINHLGKISLSSNLLCLILALLVHHLLLLLLHGLVL